MELVYIILAVSIYAIAMSIWVVLLLRKVSALEDEREYILDVLEEIDESLDGE